MLARTRSLVVTGLLVFTAPLHAQDATQGTELHGFGGWFYGRTNRNVYLGGLPEGDYRQVAISGNLSKRVDEKLSMHAQVDVIGDDDATHVELDYAFADYRVSDRLSLRIGQVKHPFGLYTEIYDVGTLRPFFDLPQGFYGPVGFVGESYKGVGLSGREPLGTWTVDYDLYAGGNQISKLAAPEAYYRGRPIQDASEESELQSTRDVIGGRVVLRTAVQGLSVGVSSYTGTLDEPAANHRTVVAGQISYRTNALTLESEFAHEDQVNDERATGGYVLAAYRITPEWQVAAQYNGVRNTFAGVDASSAPSLQDHRESAFTVNRWLTRALVIKTEVHFVSGNRFAMPDPENLASTIAARALRTTTQLFKFGAQFTF